MRVPAARPNTRGRCADVASVPAVPRPSRPATAAPGRFTPSLATSSGGQRHVLHVTHRRPARALPTLTRVAPLNTAPLPPALADALAALHDFLAIPAQRDGAAAVLAAVLALLLVKACDLAATRDWLDRKLTRKLVHTLAGPGFVLCWPLFSSSPNARLYAAAVPAANLLRLVAVGAGALRDEGTVKSMSREGDRKELLRGPTFYVLALIATTLLAWRSSPVSALVVALMCGGDGLADIAGRRWGGAKGGKGRLPWNGAKSWAGSWAMFLGGSAMAAGIIALFVRCGFFVVDPAPAAAAIAATAGLATLAESLPLNSFIDDNISVPALAALAGWWLLRPVG